MSLYTTILGSGEPLVILHGLFGSGENWLPLAKKFATTFTVYLPDCRNHGRSFHAENHSYNDLSEDLRQWFDQYQLKQASIIGHSMGGKAAMVFALRFPYLVSRLIVADMAPHNYNNSFTDTFRQSIATMNTLDLQHFSKRNQIMAVMKAKLPDSRMVGFFAKNIKKDNNTNQFYWQCNLEVFAHYIREIRGGIDIYRPDHPCQIPTLFVYGADSPYRVFHYRHQCRLFFSNTQFEKIEKAGHWLHSEQPEKFFAITSRFLQNQP